jgi:hypothetical protein
MEDDSIYTTKSSPGRQTSKDKRDYNVKTSSFTEDVGQAYTGFKSLVLKYTASG